MDARHVRRGGPGAIYRLDASNGYKPQLFADRSAERSSELRRRARQHHVRPLEQAGPGLRPRDRHDPPVRSRRPRPGQLRSRHPGPHELLRCADRPVAEPEADRLQPVLAAKIPNCPAKFDNTPECWNFAESGRRVWGLGMWKGPNGETRLFYSVASSPDLGGSDWNALPEDEKRNTLWSVRLGRTVRSIRAGVRRETVLPDFFSNPQDVARAGYSRPASDITFPACSGRPVMLVAERGGLRNLGLGRENPFATRMKRAPSATSSTRPVPGARSVATTSATMTARMKARPSSTRTAPAAPRSAPATPPMAARPARPTASSGSPGTNCARRKARAIATARSQQSAAQQVSTRGSAESEYQPDDFEVHGAQGQPEDIYNALVPPLGQPPRNRRERSILLGPGQAYMVDIDVNIDGAGNPIQKVKTRRTTRP